MGSPPGAAYQGYALDPLETLSGPQTPRRLSSPLTQNPGSAPVGLSSTSKDFLTLQNVLIYCDRRLYYKN